MGARVTWGRQFKMSMNIVRYGGSVTACCDDIGICCYGSCCPCAQFGANQEYVGDNCFLCCCAFTILADLGCEPCLHASQRDKLEVHLGGQPKGLCGQLCCDTCCCSWCAICQEARAIKGHRSQPPPQMVQPAQQQPMVVSVNVGGGAPPPAPAPYYPPAPPPGGGMLPPHIMADFKQQLEAEYVHHRGACVGAFFQRHQHELAPHQAQWCDQQENICRSNPNHVYTLQ